MRRFLAAMLAICPVLAVSSASGDPPAWPHKGDLATVPVEGDRDAFVVHGDDGDTRVLVYLHGRCGDPHAGIKAFANEVAGFGTLVSVQADLTCPDRKGRFRWSGDVDKAARRIDAAVKAVSKTRKVPLDDKRTLIGYSEGALRAESLAKRLPETYPRAILLASPKAPEGASFTRSTRVALVVGERDVQADMRLGDESLAKAGVDHKLFTLPGARHGTYGTDAPRVMTELFTWLFAQSGSEPTRSTTRE